jgi:hypothetical protein
LSDYDGVEASWGPEPVPARLEASKLLGLDTPCLRLHFTNPKTGRDIDIAIAPRETPSTHNEHIWRYELDGADIVIHPSVHFVGHFHSGNPARFRLVGITRGRA